MKILRIFYSNNFPIKRLLATTTSRFKDVRYFSSLNSSSLKNDSKHDIEQKKYTTIETYPTEIIHTGYTGKLNQLLCPYTIE